MAPAEEAAPVGPLRAKGEHVDVRTVTEGDLPAYRLAVEQSRARLSAWNPVNPEDLLHHLRVQSRDHRTFLVHALTREGEHDIVGKVNVTNVVRGRSCSAGMGYDAYDPYAGRGLFAEGLRLVIGLVLAREPAGMGLHRLEASVQPGNATSAGLLRSLGFRHEGYSSRFLWLSDAQGRHAWRDHDRYAVTVEEWPAPPYTRRQRRRLLAVVTGPDSPARTGFARALAAELGVALLREAVLDDLAVLQAVLADASGGAVVEADVHLPAELAQVPRFAVGPADRPDAREVVRAALAVRAAAG
ncbi:MAG TPA: GNAT family N-acetyltransferase [Segeticoccus sp.]|uniref:GNAT family N-acetyltransferase n=1 Tax=Segeticoccus sp. TaxID=2706531 RepID=UPI002D7EBE4F|nr:GNAT family N-acetyltransferase [Segeticoccus sp.]HET8601557.1 GNAT family N-acetyltransferase [Segeticoccus sp.]